MLRRLLQVLACLVPLQAQSYSAPGHQQVGAIADQLIAGTAASRKVRELLWGRSLQAVAVWADCAKGVKTQNDVDFTYDEDLNLYPECAAFSSPGDRSRFENFVRANWKQCGTAHDREYCHNQYHYADISVLRDHYDPAYVGANNHDVVHAIAAAIAKLEGEKVPEPFRFADDTEALMLLAHYVGDIHQPLHVAAIYLDDHGQMVDPDRTGYKKGIDNAGGNFLKVGNRVLHAEWDAIAQADSVYGSRAQDLVGRARQVPDTAGDLMGWSTQWANDAIRAARAVAFGGLSFTMAPANGDWSQAANRWEVSGDDFRYRALAADIKEDQIAKAGARLAQLLRTIWPDPAAAGYLPKAALAGITAWLPAPPPPHSDLEQSDFDAFKTTRALLKTPRGQMAAEDDVFDPALILKRFEPALGFPVPADAAPTLIRLLARVQADANALVTPVKVPLAAGGRERPLVHFPQEPTCLYPTDLAGHAPSDLITYKLKESGSYPSTHALMGAFVGLALAQAIPERSDAVFARGMEFGQSRVVCGFHYPTDLVGGRIAAAYLFAVLQSDADFDRDMAGAIAELRALRSQEH